MSFVLRPLLFVRCVFFAMTQGRRMGRPVRPVRRCPPSLRLNGKEPLETEAVPRAIR